MTFVYTTSVQISCVVLQGVCVGGGGSVHGGGRGAPQPSELQLGAR